MGLEVAVGTGVSRRRITVLVFRRVFQPIDDKHRDGSTLRVEFEPQLFMDCRLDLIEATSNAGAPAEDPVDCVAPIARSGEIVPRTITALAIDRRTRACPRG